MALDPDKDICEQFDALLKEQGWAAAFEIISSWIQEDKHRITRPDVQHLAMKHARAIAGYFAMKGRT